MGNDFDRILDAAPDSGSQALWLEVCARRIAAWEHGEVESLSERQAFAILRQGLPG